MLKPVDMNNRKKVALEKIFAELPDHQHDFYADISQKLPEKYHFSKKGIGLDSPFQKSVFFCSPFRVRELVQSPSQNWSRVVELVNPAGELVDCIIPEGKLTGKPREAIALLSDRGLRVFDEEQISLILGLVRNWEVPAEAQLQLVERVGWTADHDAFILTSGRVISRADASKKFKSGGDANGKEIGEIGLWRESVAPLAVGNPNLLFAIALGFSTALMPFTDLNTAIFHFYGRTTRGKTRVLRAALTVWPRIGSREKTWEGTANGLEGEIAKSHSTLMGLDELRGEATPDLPAIIYKFANGSAKSRGRKEGGVHDRADWSTAVISTGEYSFVETVRKLGAIQSGGQGVRMLDIPAEGAYGVFDELHGFDTSDEFVARLDKVVKKVSGPAGAAFVEQLLALTEEELEDALEADRRAHGQALQHHLDVIAGDDKTAEVRRVVASFALVATAGEWATKWGLTGWEPGMAAEAVKIIARRWLDGRNQAPVEQARELEKVRDYLAVHEPRFIALSDAKAIAEAEAPPGYKDDVFFYVLPATITGLSDKNTKMTAILNALGDGGYVEKGGENKSNQFRLPSVVPGRPRTYRIHRSILNFAGNPEATKTDTEKQE